MDESLTVGMNSGVITLGYGRNDGIIRLYTANENGAGEYIYCGSWIKKSDEARLLFF